MSHVLKLYFKSSSAALHFNEEFFRLPLGGPCCVTGIYITLLLSLVVLLDVVLNLQEPLIKWEWKVDKQRFDTNDCGSRFG